MALKFQKLNVVEVVRETEDAVTIHFEIPDKELYKYTPGQYLTLRVNIDGKNYNRAYSLCSSPTCDNTLAVTVKRVEDGVVSTLLNRDLRAGAQIEVLPPLGNFVAKTDAANSKHYILIGAGSGITPLMSILRTVLETEQQSQVTLLYGNRSQDSTIFRKQLGELSEKYKDRLLVIHSLSQPPQGWTGMSGRLTRGKVIELLGNVMANDRQKKEFFVCGPSAMMDEALRGLKELNIPAESVHQEHFSAPLTHPLDEESEPVTVGNGSASVEDVTVILEGEEKRIKVGRNESILEAALDNDLDPPYACMIGSCCTCKAKLLSGQVIMDDREGLTDEEIEDGFILTCQSHPTAPGVVISYDEI